MTTLYNKTALRKIKKDGIMMMYLDLQAREYNARMDDKNSAKRISFLEEENKKLKEQIERERNFAAEAIITRGKDFEPEIEDLKEQLGAKNIALDIIKQENECNKKNMFCFIKENKELKEQIKSRKNDGEEKWARIADTAITKLQRKKDKLEEDYFKLEEENDRLKEENANWKADDNNLTKVMSMVNTQLQEADYDEAWASVDGIIDIMTNILADIKIRDEQHRWSQRRYYYSP